MTEIQIILSVGAAIALYCWISNRMTHLLHPMRMELVALGDKLLDSDRLSDDDVDHINFKLDNAYSSFLAWVFAATIPIASIAVMYDRFKGRPDPTDDFPEEIRADYRKFFRLSFVSTVGNSPAASLICFVELVIIELLLFPAGRTIREVVMLPGKFDFWNHNNHKHGY